MSWTNNSLPACGQYVFGFSTGHVGTTTLSRSSSYADGSWTLLSDVAFFFEVDHRVTRHGLSVREQEGHVRDVYLKEIARLLGTRRKRVCVDLSHFTLLYFEGLIQVMRAERLPFKLVRIRRDAMETARSLGGRFTVGFRPLDAPESLELRVDATVSREFNALEKGLYAVDETEAQWLKILRKWNSGHILTCSWSEWAPMGSDFVVECVQPIARFLGLNTSRAVPDTKDHHNPEELEADRYNDIAVLMCYRSKMYKTSSTYRWIGQTLPSGNALRNHMEQFNATMSSAYVSDSTLDCAAHHG